MKKVLILVLALVLTMLLVGCGTENNEAEVNNEQNTQDVAVKPGEKVNLKLLIAQPRFREMYEDYIDQFVADYEAETGIIVTYDLEMPNADSSAEILKTRLSTGDDLDVFVFNTINEKAQYYDAGYLEDLSGEPWVDGLYDTAKSAVTYKDKIIGLPLESLTWGMLYNKDLFDELGLKPAMTLSEMAANAKAIAAAGKTPFLTAYNEGWIPQLLFPLTVGGIANSTSPDFIESMYNDEASLADISEMFDVIDLIHANTNANGLEIGGVDGCAEFATGEYGIWVQGPWFSSTILEADPDFNLGVAPLPISDDESSTMINASVSTTLGVCTYSKNKAVAKALVAYFLNEETSADFFTSCQFSPISSIHTFENYPWIDEAVAYVIDGKSYVDPTIPQAVKDESGKVLQGYYANTVTKEEVIEALDEAWKIYNEINE